MLSPETLSTVFGMIYAIITLLIVMPLCDRVTRGKLKTFDNFIIFLYSFATGLIIKKFFAPLYPEKISLLYFLLAYFALVMFSSALISVVFLVHIKISQRLNSSSKDP